LGKEQPMGRKENKFGTAKIKKLLEIMKANDLVEIEIKQGEDKIFLKRQPQGSETDLTKQAKMAKISEIEDKALDEAITERLAGTIKFPQAGGTDAGLEVIKSPLVGTFYATQSPDSPPFVEVGSKVEPQMVVCIIEAMKVMNEIKAEVGGTIAEVLVKNGQAVEFGQPLFKIRPE
jgi:acetyl-CoA carboxylase biotin carboxyl carrier protein